MRRWELRYSMSNFKDLTSQVFGKLTVTRLHSCGRGQSTKWLCLCECGREFVAYSTHLLRGKTTHCGCDPYRGRQHKQWTGCGDISGNAWGNIKRGADGSKGRQPIPFEITIEYAWALFEKQGGVCALSGLPIWFRHTTTVYSSQTASLDRIDSSKGYVEGNVQWVHKDINRMKNSFQQDYFIELCSKVAERR